MYEINRNDDKMLESEPQPGEEVIGFSSQVRQDKFLGGSSETTLPKDKEVLSKTYEIDGVNISVNYQTILPSQERDSTERLNPGKVIVFLPGWSQDAGAKSDERIGQAFADAGKMETLVIDTKPDKDKDNSLYLEAEAISRLIKEKGVKNIIIAGHSEGGIKAVDLAVVLQKQKEAGEIDLSIDGLILEEAVGLYDQGSALKFVGNFAKDGIIDAQLGTFNSRVYQREGIRSTEVRTARLTLDVIFGTFTEVIRKKGIHYPKRLASQMKELKRLNPYLSEVKAPVILVNGFKDLASNPEKILPGYKDLADREEVLKREVFPNSPFIRMVTGERLATHGMPVYRAEQIAKDSLYLLERSKREHSESQSPA